MRLIIHTSPNESFVDKYYQPKQKGTLHKWLGGDDYHGDISLYSFSKLNKAVYRRNGQIDFPQGAKWFISSQDRNFLERIVEGIQEDPSMFNGLTVESVQLKTDPVFEQTNKFLCASPIFVKQERTQDRGFEHLTWEDEKSDEVMTDLMKKKLSMAGLSNDISIAFDRSYNRANTTLISYRNIKNRANVCPVIISGDQEAVQFAYNVGVGHSTGIGFGAIEI